eukprot:COSAG06_NODE_815_length_12103_cov_4.891458_3_plen_57_part_00
MLALRHPVMPLEAAIAPRSTQSATLAVGIVSSLLLLFLDAARAAAVRQAFVGAKFS